MGRGGAALRRRIKVLRKQQASSELQRAWGPGRRPRDTGQENRHQDQDPGSCLPSRVKVHGDGTRRRARR